VRAVLIGATQGRAAGVADRDHRGLYAGGVVLQLGCGIRVTRVACVRALKGVAPDGRMVCAEGAVASLDPDTATVGRFEAMPGGEALDLHHGLVHGGRRCLAVTGRDEVWVGEARHDVRGGGDRAHPNHLFVVDGALWVTRGARGDVLRLCDGRTVDLADGVVHDGVVTDDGVWFTAVDGRLLRMDVEMGAVVATDLADLDDRKGPLGWCRGLAFVDGLAWVGFTRLRATANRARLAWVRGALRGRQVATSHPTRLVAYDLAAGRKVREVMLEEHGLHALFGVHAIPTHGEGVQRPGGEP